MGRRVRHDSPVDWHVYNRGSRRMALFRDDQDAAVFIALLRTAVEASGCVLWAYLLMTNHFHLALRGDSRQLSRCMHDLEGFYSKYHNKRYGLSGAAFEGRYEAYPQGTIPLLLRTIAYIFMNPVAAGMVGSPEAYGWSSYSSYFSDEPSPLRLNALLLLERVSSSLADARTQLGVFLERELRRIQRKEHRPGLSARDLQANHFDWLVEEARARQESLEGRDPLLLAVFWAQQAGFHRSAVHQALGGSPSSTFRKSLSTFRRWVQEPDRAWLAQIP
jgi:putative transposase